MRFAAPHRESFLIARQLVLRGLGVVFLVAFSSLWVQIDGLLGERGILPAREFLDAVEQAIPDDARWRLPTIFWWVSPSDSALNGLCLVGVVLSVLLVAGLCPRVVLSLLWACYLSIASADRLFLGYQWDVLLLQSALFALPLAPMRLWLHRETRAPPLAAVALLWWLVLQLMLSSGLVKLLSGDAVWRDLTALEYHYFTQPIPGPLSWFAHHLPHAVQVASCAAMFFIELVAPVLILVPLRAARHFAGLCFAALMALIFATGNYGFFNLLTAVLALSLFDDRALRRLAPSVLRPPPHSPLLPRRRRIGCAVLVAPLFALSGVESTTRLVDVPWPEWVESVRERVRPFRSINAYGLFADMTERRPEIEVQGSADGVRFETYVFRYKIGPLDRRPPFAHVHMPRLDWQMWFAALRGWRAATWFHAFEQRLLEGSPEVLELIEENPFSDRPPRVVRALLYDYRFTTPGERAESGDIWKREYLGPFGPPLTLTDGRLALYR